MSTRGQRTKLFVKFRNPLKSVTHYLNTFDIYVGKTALTKRTLLTMPLLTMNVKQRETKDETEN